MQMRLPLHPEHRSSLPKANKRPSDFEEFFKLMAGQWQVSMPLKSTYAGA